MVKHEVPNLVVLMVCMGLILALGILSFRKAEASNWWLYLLIFAASVAGSIVYLVYL
ncbi:MAG: hypothetical protein WCH46_06705 [bacterium]